MVIVINFLLGRQDARKDLSHCKEESYYILCSAVISVTVYTCSISTSYCLESAELQYMALIYKQTNKKGCIVSFFVFFSIQLFICYRSLSEVNKCICVHAYIIHKLLTLSIYLYIHFISVESSFCYCLHLVPTCQLTTYIQLSVLVFEPFVYVLYIQ